MSTPEPQPEIVWTHDVNVEPAATMKRRRIPIRIQHQGLPDITMSAWLAPKRDDWTDPDHVLITTLRATMHQHDGVLEIEDDDEVVFAIVLGGGAVVWRDMKRWNAHNPPSES